MFGGVRGLAEHDGEIFVLNQQVPVVRVYDLSGRHVRDLGKDGQGPGEFRQPESMVIGADGRIMILTPEGDEVGTIPIRSGFQTSTPMLITNDGTLYNNQLLDPSVDVRDWSLSRRGGAPRGRADEPESLHHRRSLPHQLHGRAGDRHGEALPHRRAGGPSGTVVRNH